MEAAGGLDNSLRRFLQNPRKILKPYLNQGTVMLDLGCGPGFFTLEAASLLHGHGQVIAADLQQGMLDKVSKKIKGTPFETTVQLHRCSDNKIGLHRKVDFIFAFFMVHEVPDHNALFREVTELLLPGGRMLIVEPKFHVNHSAFKAMLLKAQNAGLIPAPGPRMFLCRTVVLEKQ